jgi:hypothetical protein
MKTLSAASRVTLSRSGNGRTQMFLSNSLHGALNTLITNKILSRSQAESLWDRMEVATAYNTSRQCYEIRLAAGPRISFLTVPNMIFTDSLLVQLQRLLVTTLMEIQLPSVGNAMNFQGRWLNAQ